MSGETTISFRTTKLKKAQIKEIIDTINHEKDINEPKINYKILQDFFLENITNDKLKLEIEKLELKNQIKNLKNQKEYIDFKINECTFKLNDIENKINNISQNQKLQNPRLKKAIISLVETCKQRGFTDISLIPKELYTATAQSNEIKKTDLIRLAKKEFNSNPNLILDYPNTQFKYI